MARNIKRSKIPKIKALKYFNATEFLYCYFASSMLS